jgi:UDP-N-acetylglucosamine--N-acetylmuramyl-(pentapeptide) pyrophosphoryl-undecaprenol N-acetylglucosamine transferase
MSRSLTICMAGGGTGGHIIPALAVAGALRAKGHEPFFIGTRRGMEARLVPAANFPIEWIEIGGLNRVSLSRRLRTFWQLPASILRVAKLFGERRPAAVFSMGGYVAGPVTLAARLKRVPIVLMEPNAIPGYTNRKMAGSVRKAMVNFPETVDYFPKGIAEQTGVPVREAFFHVAPKAGGKFTLLILGGSQGSQKLNETMRQAWPLLAARKDALRIVHQVGPKASGELAEEFRKTGLDGEIVPFIDDVAGAMAQADLLLSRSGASTVSEIAAAGRPAILVPFPFAADNHQLRNAESFARAGGGLVIEEKDLNGERLAREVLALADDPERLQRMGEAARTLAKPGAAARAVEILEQVAR